MKTLIVGAKSRLAKALGEFPDSDIVSHRNIPVEGTYSAIYIFSYSFVMAENISLLDKVSKLTSPAIILISSITTLIGQQYKFRYPTIKRKCEKLAEDRGFTVVRIGLVLETMPKIPVSGSYVITPLAEIRNMIEAGSAVCPKPEIISFWGGKGQLVEKCYVQLLIILGPVSFLIRPVDLVLKLFGQSWYGYNSLIVDFFRNEMK